jgi:polyribonucleotide nucleotidyltransferase
MSSYTETLDWVGGQPLQIETGRLARQADGSVVLRHGDTMLLASVVARKEIKPDVDFLPLSVDYQEKYAAAGKFPGGFFKRDGRLNEHEILTSRIVDRSIRPLFPEDYHADIQVMVSLISSDRETQADALACVAASAALMVSDIPFADPVSTVRVTFKEGAYHVNPTVSEMEGVELDLIVAGTMDSVVMVEGEMSEVSEAVMLEAIRTAHESIKRLNQAQLNLRTAKGKPTREYAKPEVNEALVARVKALATDKLRTVVETVAPKQTRGDNYKAVKTEVIAALAAENAEWTEAVVGKTVSTVCHDLESELMREMILSKGVRLDGRKTDEIRPIWCEATYLPRAHGSAIFTRGETQSLSSVTLGSKLDEQTIDYATREGSKRFMLQYNFPPFSTGEVKPLRAPSRREQGHGNLAERALKILVPDDVEYTVRVVSDILESNGSSSMATVCAGCLALMDAGIPIKRPVSGIAMGLIVEGNRWAVLSDILGDEDHLGDMDFKVTGTSQGLTACQMDIKVRGLSFEILEKALLQAKAGREHILGVMVQTLAEPRKDVSEFAPRIMKMEISNEFIGAVIGTGGKVIQEIQRSTGTTIAIEEVGRQGIITISSPDKSALEAAYNWIKGIVTMPDIGETYTGTVRQIKDSGAVLDFLPGKDGWLHISEISYKRLDTLEGVLEVGEEFPVKLIAIENGRFRLSRKALLPKPEGYVESEEDRPRPPRRDGDRGRGGFGGGRGPRRGGSDR